MDNEIKFCGKCGSAVDNSLNFCPDCGAMLGNNASNDDNSFNGNPNNNSGLYNNQRQNPGNRNAIMILTGLHIAFSLIMGIYMLATLDLAEEIFIEMYPDMIGDLELVMSVYMIAGVLFTLTGLFAIIPLYATYKMQYFTIGFVFLLISSIIALSYILGIVGLAVLLMYNKEKEFFN